MRSWMPLWTLWLSILLTAVAPIAFAHQSQAFSNGPALNLTQEGLDLLILQTLNWKLQKRYGGSANHPASGVFIEHEGEGKKISEEFLYYLDQTIKALWDREEQVNTLGLRWGKINSTVRLMIRFGSILVTDKKIVLNGVEKDAVNDPKSFSVLLNRDSWKKANRRQKAILTLHEVLGASHMPDANYENSIALFNMIKTHPFFVSPATILTTDEKLEFESIPLHEVGWFANSAEFTKREFNDSVSIDGRTHSCIRSSPEDKFVFLEVENIERNKIYLNWAARCWASRENRIEIPLHATEQRDPQAIYDISGTRLLKNGVQVGWISGDDLFLKTPEVKLRVHFDRANTTSTRVAAQIRLQRGNVEIRSTVYSDAGTVLDRTLWQGAGQ